MITVIYFCVSSEPINTRFVQWDFVTPVMNL